MMDDLDARDVAFASLLPVAELTERAVARVQTTLDDERKLLGIARERINIGQRAALDGLARFAHAVVECGDEWRRCPSIRRVSTPKQETGAIYLWLLDDRFMLRIKHEPVAPRVDPGVLRLTPQLPAAGELVQVYFTWDVSMDGRIVRPTFVCLDEPAWTIPLAELLAQTRSPVLSVARQRRGAIVRSARTAPDQVNQRANQRES